MLIQISPLLLLSKEVTVTTLKQLRKRIDQIDARIIKQLSQRRDLSLKIGQLKITLGKNVLDKKRESAIKEWHRKLCNRYQLPYSFVKKIFDLIIKNSRNLQK